MAADLASLQELAEALTELYEPVPVSLGDLIEAHLSAGRLRVTERLWERLRFDIADGIVTAAREAQEDGEDEIEDMFIEARCVCEVPDVEFTGVPSGRAVDLDGDLPWEQYANAVATFGRNVGAPSIALADARRY